MKSVRLKLQMWGNSLAVRIPSDVARSAKLGPGQAVDISVQHFGVAIEPVGPREMSLSERLAAYDIATHGGEVMATRRTVKEA